MVRAPRSITSVETLAFVAMLVVRAGHEARAQVFDYAINDANAGGALGSAVARIGDIDSDGCEDFAVGEPKATAGGYAETGIVRLMSGKTGAEFKELAGFGGANFGAALDGRIDLDGDGYFDLLIGAPLDPTLYLNGGSFHGFSPHRNLWLFDAYSGQAGVLLGSAVRSLEGDLDNDGIDDFVVGAPGIDTAYVYSGGMVTQLFANTGQSGAGFGTDVCRGGDLDNDGFVDYLVGSPDYVDSGGTKTGRVTAFSGKNGNKLWSVDGAADSKFGRSLSQPGDLDGDGQGDIVVGAPQHLDSGGNKTGCVIVLSGLNQSVLYKVFGDQANDTFGHDVHGVGGDLDNDGTVDFIVGAPQLLGSDVGYARVISGAHGSTLFTCLEHSNDPNTKSDYGVAVCGGDFDGNGRTDVLIGGSNFNSGDGVAEVWTTAVASWNNYGSGWLGTNGVPGLTAQSDPVVGKPLTLDLDNSAGITTPGLLLIGLGKANIHTGKGGTILVDPLLLIALSVPASGLTLPGQIPHDPSLYGLDLYLQGLELDRGASNGLSFTRGLDLHFGF